MKLLPLTLAGLLLLLGGNSMLRGGVSRRAEHWLKNGGKFGK